MFRLRFIATLILSAACLSGTAGAQEAASLPPTFDKDIAPILNEYCIFCHRGDRARNGLRFDSYAAMMQGGSGGPAVEAGNSGGSLLYQLVSHQREPAMPPDEPRLSDEVLAAIREWIDAGAAENAAAVSAAPRRTAPEPMTVVTPGLDTPATLPQGLSTAPFWWTDQPGSITAIAASPTTPLVAIAGYRQILLHHTQTLELLGVLDHPAGDIAMLRFIGNGSTLLAGGGVGATSGDVTLFDTATGKTLLRVGDEPDVVLAADVTADHLLVAHGGPRGSVTVRTIADQKVLHTIDAHTDWITAVAFSPDGVLLATADRSGNVFVWEALTGREFHRLTPHQGRITSLAWRGDSIVLASAGEDAAVRMHDMNNGQQVTTWNARSPVLGLDWNAGGSIVTAGRDGVARVWNSQGQITREMPALPELISAAALDHEAQRVIAGDLAGNLRVFAVADGADLGELAANPPPPAMLAMMRAQAALQAVEARLGPQQQADEEAIAALTAAEQALAQTMTALDAATAAATSAESARNDAAAQLAAVRAQVAPVEEAIADARKRQAELDQTLTRTRAEAEAAKLQMLTAWDEVISARADVLTAHDDPPAREQAEKTLQQRRTLYEGAAAIAQLAAQKLAALDLHQPVIAREVDRWQALLTPRTAELEQLAANLQQADQALTAAQSQVGPAEAARDQAAATVATATSTREAAGAALAQLQTELQAARDQFAAAQQHWQERRTQIQQARGRVNPS